MSFNLSSQNTVEALFVFNSLMRENGYAVNSISIRTGENGRRFVIDYVPSAPKYVAGWIECDFSYSQSATTMRVDWYNQTTGHRGRMLLQGIHAGHCGMWDQFRQSFAPVFSP